MKTGQWVMTRSIAEKVRKNEDFAFFILESTEKYLRKNWGDICKEDWKMNDEAVKNGDDRIVARYDNIFIITEWDRSLTTILFTEEY